MGRVNLNIYLNIQIVDDNASVLHIETLLFVLKVFVC